MVSEIKIRMYLCLSVANNVVFVEDIIEMNNVDDMLTGAVRYNARIWCHYIAGDIKIRLDNLDEINNGFTWMKCFTQGFHYIDQSWHF